MAMDQDNVSKRQSQYGSIEQTSSTTNSHDNNTNSVLKLALEQTDAKMPPKAALRQKSLKSIEKSNGGEEQMQTQLEKNNNSMKRSQDNENTLDFSAKRPSVAPASLSMSQVLQQQAINKELAQRHRSLKRANVTKEREQEEEEEANKSSILNGFQNKAFNLEPDQSSTTDKSNSINKMIDQNPLSLLIKRPKSNEQQQQQQPEQELNNANVTSVDDDFDESNLRPYPRKVFFIVANEFCERFSYYGLRTVLVLYFKSVLGMSDSQSTVNYHLFAALCYLTPLLGAILGDSVWGKFRTILYLSIVYFFGELILVASAIQWQSSAISNWLTLLGLLLIGLGTGGIKPCVSAFGGDQFLAQETKRRAAFFSIFYASINAGSLISMFVTPMLRSDVACVGRLDCFPLAFALPCLLMLVSIVSFLLAKNQYTRVELPQKNVIVAFSRCVFIALKRKLTSCKKDTNTNIKTDSTNSLEIASQLSENCKNQRKELEKHWIYLASDQYDTSSLEDFRSVLAILLLFLPIPVYWCLYDQQGSVWTLQAARMDGRVPASNFIIQPDQISVANPILLLAAIPLFECFIYPTLRRYKLLRTPIGKITAGGFLAALTFVVSAAIEFSIQANMPPLEPAHGLASLRLVNGLADCKLVKFHVETNFVVVANESTNNHNSLLNQQFNVSSLESHQNMLIANASVSQYALKFQVASASAQLDLNSKPKVMSNCALDPSVNHALQLAKLVPQTSQLLFLEQGNGKLKYHLFNESWQLPEANQARVLLLFESFGSLASSAKQKFTLMPNKQTSRANDSTLVDVKYHFNKIHSRFGSVYMFEAVDFEVPPRGLTLKLQTKMDQSNDKQSFKLINLAADNKQEFANVHLKAGTRNLIVVHQASSELAYFRHSITQDNNYRINILWQLIPYLMISMSEVLFSITGLEFSYSIAPETMKSVILGAWFLTTAVGNILTVAVEAVHPFSNVAYDLLFYAALMLADMLLFMFIGLNFKPYTKHNHNYNQITQ